MIAGCTQSETANELAIGSIDIPSFRWGRQTATFEVTNNSDWMKYVTVETEIRFEGSYLNPVRVVQTHYPLIPGETSVLTPEIDVPGNYGKASLYVRLYDVVDTLDELMPGQKVFEQPFKLTFHVPEAAFSYLQEKVVLPPTVDNNPLWDSEISHLLPVLLGEGKSQEEIAAILEADIGFVEQIVETMTGLKLLEKRDDGSVVPSFPIFMVKQAEETKELVEQSSDRLVKLIMGNMDDYRTVLDSMIDDGSLTSDSNDFIHGGTVLYRKFPVVGGLLLWYDLGQRFIGAGDPLTPFEGTDPCHALLGRFMYAVQGGDVFNGHHYYLSTKSSVRIDITFGDNIPEISCPKKLDDRRILRERSHFNYGKEDIPEVFIVSASLIDPAMAALGKGTEELFPEFRDELTGISSNHGHAKVSVAQRYWFWNQVASRTLEKLVDDGAVSTKGNGMFKFQVTM
jgi:hypothetical protein